MKKILGLDLGTTSIGWALVNEAENPNEKSLVINLGVRVNPLTVDELSNFEKGKSITTNADRTLKRSMRRNLQRYKLRRANLISILKEFGIINNDTLLTEDGENTTHQTYKLRAEAVTQRISLEEFARVLLMINKKRGYKSSRKAKNQEEGKLIDGMEIAKILYEENLTPGQYSYKQLKNGKHYIPDYYRSDLLQEFGKVWNFQKETMPEILTESFRKEIEGKPKRFTSIAFYKKYGFNTAELKGTRDEKKLKAYQLRNDAVTQPLSKEEVAFVLTEINNDINGSSGYLGSISDRSKELYFNKITVGQYLYEYLLKFPDQGLRNKVFYRQDYMDEFEAIWENQAKYHAVLTNSLKQQMRDVIIFYQRRLKSQKNLISLCEFERREIPILIGGEEKRITVGLKVCPRSSPIFQEFKIWQTLNNAQVRNKRTGEIVSLLQEEKELLARELQIRNKLSMAEVLKLLYKDVRDLELNFKEIQGNSTVAELFSIYCRIVELTGHGEVDYRLPAARIREIIEEVFNALNYDTRLLVFNSELPGKSFEEQPLFKLWHLLYSFEGDDSNTGNDKLVKKLMSEYGFEKEYAVLLTNASLIADYGSLSTKALRKILPHMKEGNEYSVACAYAGYRHSKNSLTRQEIDSKILKDKLEVLPKNSLRNPVVEKILNQMINVVNKISETYGKPDEIRIELARELKKNAKEREQMTNSQREVEGVNETYRKVLRQQFGLIHISRNDIIRYKLYLELEPRGFKTLYSDTYISPSMLFSKEFDIEHIIPQARLFDDSFSNKTLETRSVNINKKDKTACDYIAETYHEDGLNEYKERVNDLYKAGKISTSKFKKLNLKGEDIPNDFIDRDIRNTQYIASKARMILEEIAKDVIPTSGSITDKLREDWQLINVMQELNWNKYDKLGLTEIIENRDGHKIKRIKDWTKRNDHRHHAMDALTIAFTKREYINYLNNLNARSDKSGNIYAIEQKYCEREDGKMRFKPPIQIDEFRATAKKHLEKLLVSYKSKNKVLTANINATQKSNGVNRTKQFTPRGQLHLETIYGSIQQYKTWEEKIGASFDEEKIRQVTNAGYRNALLSRLELFGNNPKIAFTGKNSFTKNPLYVDSLNTIKVPDKVKLVCKETVYTIRKPVGPDLNIEKVLDKRVKGILQARLDEYGGDANRAFTNLEANPIWINKEKGIKIKRVKIAGIANALALRDKKDKFGKIIPDGNGNKQGVDFVNTGNNHHVAIYRDAEGALQEKVVSFYEATLRKNMGLPVIDYNYNSEIGWEYLFDMKQNEYFVFPNKDTGFNPHEIDLSDQANYHLISPNLFRVQKLSSRYYVFNHHLETKAVDGEVFKNYKNLSGISYHLIQSPKQLLDLIKVSVNHIGLITSVEKRRLDLSITIHD